MHAEQRGEGPRSAAVAIATFAKGRSNAQPQPSRKPLVDLGDFSDVRWSGDVIQASNVGPLLERLF